MCAAVRQTTRVLHSNKSLMEGIVNMQKELKNTVGSNMLMVKDLQQNTAHHRGLFASLSRDIHWIKQKQHDRKRLKQANCLLHEKTTELKDKLLAAETQAGSDKRGFEEQLQAVGSERDEARQQTEERDSALKSAQSDYSELQKERDRGQAAHEEALLCIRNEAKCMRETYRRELTTLDSELHQSLQRNQAQNEASLQNLEDIRANHRTKSEEFQREICEKQQQHEHLCGKLHELQRTVDEGKLELQELQERQAQERQGLVQQHSEHSQQQEARIEQMEASQRQQLEENEKELGRAQAEERRLRGDLERVQGELNKAEEGRTSEAHNMQLVLQLKGQLDAAVSGRTKAEDAHAELRRDRDALASRVEEAQAELGGVQDAARQSASEAATKLEALERQTATLQGQEQESRSRREDLEKEMHEVRRQGDEAARAARTESDKCEALEKKQQAAELELSRVASELSAVREQLTRECAQRQEQERDLAHVPLRVQRPCTVQALPMHYPCTVPCILDTLHMQESELVSLKPKYKASLAAAERAEQGQAAAEERARALEQQLAQRAGGDDDPAPPTRSVPPPTEARAWAARQAVADLAGPASTLGTMERQSPLAGVAASTSALPSVGLGPGGAPDAVAPGQLEQRAPPMQSLHTSSRRRNSSTSKRSFMDMRLPTDIDPHAFAPVAPRAVTSVHGPATAASFIPLPPKTHMSSPKATAAPAPVPASVPAPVPAPVRLFSCPRPGRHPAPSTQ